VSAWISVTRDGIGAGRGEGLQAMVDSRCLAGVAVSEALATLCVAADPGQALRFDEPEVQQARRDFMEHRATVLGDDLICVTTLALDESRCAGAITVTRGPVENRDDPFARLFPPRSVVTSIFCAVEPPPGPVTERYAGVPWPGGRFEKHDE
jgi:hypothetical protein